MASRDLEQASEQTKLLYHVADDRRLSALVDEDDATSVIDSFVSKEEQALAAAPVGERLPYNDYTTIDWLHDLVKDSYRRRSVHKKDGLRDKLIALSDSCSGWVAAALIGIVTACIAFLVDVAEVTVSDWKLGYCRSNPFLNELNCCSSRQPLLIGAAVQTSADSGCTNWHVWTSNWYGSFGIFVAFAVAFGVISSSLTMLTKSTLPSASSGSRVGLHRQSGDDHERVFSGKSIYLAAGSGIPEIKTILSGFVIPHFLDFKVLTVKAVGAVFAVASGMCLGKEGPFVHISTCVAFLVGRCLPKYRENGRKMRELLSAGCSSGLSVAFGAPIGGVLFSYEEISTYFPRKVLWRAFFCSLWAAMILKALNPTGTGKLVLFETDYATSYSTVHYLVFIFLGVAGGLWGGIFCRCNFLWSKYFRRISIIQNNPVLEVFFVVLATGLLQYPNPLAREPGDIIIKTLLQDCQDINDTWICRQEATEHHPGYIGWLIYGTIVKLVLTIVTFGCKVPSGIIIPALDAGAFFGRLMGQLLGNLSPGIFAMVGAAAFLAGVSRMTISLCVIMFELTGELEYIVPHMIAILVAKWVADYLSPEGVYDLAQTVLGHPFLDTDHAISLVQAEGLGILVEELIPPKATMRDITIDIRKDEMVPRSLLEQKLEKLKERGLMDAGLVLVRDGMLQGYLAEGELDFGLNELGKIKISDRVRLLGSTGGNMIDEGDVVDRDRGQEILDLSSFVDRTPLSICAKAPMEYAVEMFGKLGLRHLCVIEEGTGKLVGVIIKKRLVVWLDKLKRDPHDD